MHALERDARSQVFVRRAVLRYSRYPAGSRCVNWWGRCAAGPFAKLRAHLDKNFQHVETSGDDIRDD
jgi:hypothetical protein